MQWYWWALIVVAAVAIAAIKVKVLSGMKRRHDAKRKALEEDDA